MTATVMSNMNQCCTPEDDDQIHLYKKCMEDIAEENPHLPIVVIQQMTLKRCTVIQEERKQRKKSNPSDILRGMMRKLRLSNSNKREEHDLEIGSTIGSSTEQQQLEAEVWRNGRSIACRRSVASISSEDRSAALAQLIDFNDDESLSHSLQKIESSIMFDPSTPDCNKRRSRRSLVDSKRSSKRVSDMSLGLSDVEEYEVAKQSELASKVICSQIGDTSLVNSSQSTSFVEKKEESSTRLLPDEIKVLLNDFKADNNNNNKGKKKKKILCQLESEKKRNNSSVSLRSSSILSVDSDNNFGGDFAAWASFRRLSSN